MKRWLSPEGHMRARPQSFAGSDRSAAAAALNSVGMGGAVVEGADLDVLNSRPHSYCVATHSPNRAKRLRKKIKEKEKKLKKLEGVARKLSHKKKAAREVLLQRKLREVTKRTSRKNTCITLACCM